MTIKDKILQTQLDGLRYTDVNGLSGQHVARTLTQHRDLWSMFYFGDMELIVFPADGHDDDLFALFSELNQDELTWEELDGKRFLRAWWD